MKEFLFHKRSDAQDPAPEEPVVTEVKVVTEVTGEPQAPETPEVPEVPETPEVTETPEVPEAPEEAQEEVSMAYLLEQLEAIRKDSAYGREVMDKIISMPAGNETKICQLANIVEEREKTNRELIAVYTGLLKRKAPPKGPNFDGWGKKWSELKDKAKTTMEINFTPEQDAEIKRQIDEAAQNIQDATRNVDETIRRSIDKAVEVIRQAARGTKEAYTNWTASVRQEEPTRPEKVKRGTPLEMVTGILRDPSLSVEEKELIFDHIEEIRDVNEDTQAKVLEILGDVTLSLEEKELILDHLEDLQELS